MFLITSYTIVSAMSLYIFFKFSRIVFYLLEKKNLVKLYQITIFNAFIRVLLPYSITMTILIVIMELLAFIGSITESESDDPNEYSYYWDVVKVAAIIINTINFIAISIIYRIFIKNRE